MRRLTHWFVVMAAAGWVTGCGARSGDELPFGFGGSGVGATGGGGTGGGGGAPYGGYGGMPYGGYGGAPYGGYGGMPMGGYGGSPYGGYGGMPMGGYGGTPYGGYGGMPIGGYGGMPIGGYGGMPMGGYGGMPFGGFGGMPMGGFGGVGGGPSVSCCIPHQFPGCTPPQWAACVCQTDSYCCTTAWDNLCVSEIDSLGCGYCGGGTGGMGGVGGFGGMGGTGGGVFCPGGQYCSNLQVPGAPIVLPGCCPSTSPNACGLDTTQLAGLVPLPKGCTPKNQPGKPDPTCPPLPIGTGQMLPGCCKPSGMCGNDFSPIQLGCVNTSPYGGPPPTKCGGGGTGGTGGMGGTGGVGGFGGTGGTGGFTGSCCQTHGWPGCDNPKIWQCVCPKDPYCCQSQWDSICVGEVTSLGCGSCGGTGGAGGTSGAGGTGGGSCDPAKCQLPPPMLGCCVTPNGPCGAITPSGCQPL